MQTAYDAFDLVESNGQKMPQIVILLPVSISDAYTLTCVIV